MRKLTQSPKTLRATRKLAQEFSAMEPAPKDRPLSPKRLQVYEKVMREGGFRPVNWASTTCSETNCTYRVNGKHTSYLLSTMEDIPELFVVLERYHCDTLEDVARLYSTYDSKIQSRSVGDINRTFASCIPDLHEVSHKIINRVISAVCFHKAGGMSDFRQPQERAEEIFDAVGFCLWTEQILTGGSTRINHLMRVPVVAAMYGSYNKSKDSATTFWSSVRDETGVKPDLPDRKLARFLITNASAKGCNTDKPKRYRVSDREFYVKCLHAWNAWRKSEATNLAYFADADVPKII